MNEKYGEYEQVNGATCNRLMDRIAELERQIAAVRELPEKWMNQDLDGVINYEEDNYPAGQALALNECACELSDVLAPKEPFSRDGKSTGETHEEINDRITDNRTHHE